MSSGVLTRHEPTALNPHQRDDANIQFNATNRKNGKRDFREKRTPLVQFSTMVETLGR
jgi:hypothetical protein